MEPSLAADLKKLRLEQMKNKMRFGSEYSKLNFVFCKPDGSRLRERTLHTAFERIKKKANVPDIRIHDLRHTFVVLSLEAGIPLEQIQHDLGHESISITADTYTHLTKKLRKESRKKFSEYMSNSF
ncbi:tyrosine-type recombinase/integrase [Caldibacillus thermoamylovorans]